MPFIVLPTMGNLYYLIKRKFFNEKTLTIKTSSLKTFEGVKKR